MAKNYNSKTEADANNTGRFYSTLLSLSAPDDSPQTHRRRVLGQLQIINGHLRARSRNSVGVTGHHPSTHLIAVLAYRANEAHLIPVRALQKGLGFTAGGVTRRLDIMVRDGLLERVPDPADGRALLIRLTQAGNELAEVLLRDADRRSYTLEQAFTPQEWQVLSDLLHRFEKAVE